MTLPAFQQYQQAFTAHIRSPQDAPRPQDVDAKRMQVYNQIVFNNIDATLAACFPVCKKVLGIRAWTKLVRQFFAGHRCHAPLFRQIPEEFLTYLESVTGLPQYLYSLAHYEWMELAIAVMDVTVDARASDTSGELLDARPVFAPAMAILSYSYPVQKISPRFRPTQPLAEPVHLLVFRDADDAVRFVELNQMTARLMCMLQSDALTCRQALARLAEESGENPQVFVEFGQGLLEELRSQGIILGVYR